jgi:hypothetical protein
MVTRVATVAFEGIEARAVDVQVQLSGEVGERRLNVTIPLHVGVWPPPDFEDEDKKLLQ